jgi:hypothetical protein
MDMYKSQQMTVALVGNKRGHLVDMLTVSTIQHMAKPTAPVVQTLERTKPVCMCKGFMEALDEIHATAQPKTLERTKRVRDTAGFLEALESLRVVG